MLEKRTPGSSLCPGPIASKIQLNYIIFRVSLYESQTKLEITATPRVVPTVHSDAERDWENYPSPPPSLFLSNQISRMTDQMTRWSGFGLQTRSFLAFFSSLSSSSRLQVRNEIFLMPWYSLLYRCGFVRFAPLDAVSFRVNEKKTNRWKYAIV